MSKLSRIWMFLVFICGSGTLLAQTAGQSISAIESQTLNINSTEPDSIKIRHLLEWSDKLVRFDIDSALHLLQKALAISLGRGYSRKSSKALSKMGSAYLYKGDYKMAGGCFKKALDIFQSDPKNRDTLKIIQLTNDCSVPYIGAGRYDSVAYYSYQALALANAYHNESVKKMEILVRVYIHLSLVWKSLNQYDQAMMYAVKTEEAAKRTGANDNLAEAYLNRADILFESQKFSEARTFYQKAIQAAELAGYKEIKQSALLTLGGIFLNENNPQRAIPLFEAAVKLNEAVHHPGIPVVSGSLLGQAYFQLKNFSRSEKLLQDAVAGADSMGTDDGLKDALRTLSELYTEKHQYKKALEYKDKYYAFLDSQFSNQKLQTINLLEMRSRTALKDKEIAEKRLLLVQKDNQLKGKNILIGGISAGAAVMIILILSFYRINLHKQRLQAEKIHNMKQEQEIGELKAMIKGEERERTRIARDLHDGLGSMLSATVMNCAVLAKENRQLPSSDTYREVVQLLDEMGHEMRKTANNLMPVVLLKYSLPEAVKQFCDHIQNGKGFNIDLQTFGQFDLLEHEFTLSVYRIMQELINNVIKHAQASHVIVQMIMHDTSFGITVEDDGIGFDMGNQGSGMGLRNLQARVKSMNGQLNIESKEGSGTTVYIEFDLYGAKKTMGI